MAGVVLIHQGRRFDLLAGHTQERRPGQGAQLVGVSSCAVRAMGLILVRAYMWVVGSTHGWGVYKRQPMDISPSLKSNFKLHLSMKIILKIVFTKFLNRNDYVN